MKYRELLNIRAESHEYKAFESALSAAGVTAPPDVKRQFYFDHRTKGAFIAQYGDIDLLSLHRHQESRMATELLTATIYPEFQNWVDICARRFDSEPTYDAAILHPEEVKDHWRKEGTWQTIPIFLHPSVVGKGGDTLHLVEGHTRLGCLRGAVRHGLVEPRSRHKIWVGRSNSRLEATR